MIAKSFSSFSCFMNLNFILLCCQSGSRTEGPADWSHRETPRWQNYGGFLNHWFSIFFFHQIFFLTNGNTCLKKCTKYQNQCLSPFTASVVSRLIICLNSLRLHLAVISCYNFQQKFSYHLQVYCWCISNPHRRTVHVLSWHLRTLS